MNKNIGPLKVLSASEMVDVQTLTSIEKQKYIVAGYVDFIYKYVMLFRADGVGVRVPFTVFTPSANCSPNFEELDIIDYGQTVKLGKYEAAADFLLEEVAKLKLATLFMEEDPDYKSYCNLFNNKDIN
jgi:hypothetical protein